MYSPPSLVSDKHPAYSLLLIFGAVFLGFALIGPLIGMQLGSIFYEGDLMKDLANMGGAGDRGFFYALMIVQGAATGIGLILIPWLQLLGNRKELAPFFPSAYRLPFVLLVITVLGFNYIAAMSPIVEWNANLQFPESLEWLEKIVRAQEDQLAGFTKAATQFESVSDLLLGLLVIAVLPAIGEELVFRGLIQNEFWRGSKNIHVAIWVSAFIFSAIHTQFYGFVPRVLLGALFGYLYYWSGNLLIPIFAHLFNNAFGVIGIYLQQRGLIDIDVEEAEALPWPAVLMGAILTVLLLIYLWKFFSQHYARPGARADHDAFE